MDCQHRSGNDQLAMVYGRTMMAPEQTGTDTCTDALKRWYKEITILMDTAEEYQSPGEVSGTSMSFIPSHISNSLTHTLTPTHTHPRSTTYTNTYTLVSADTHSRLGMHGLILRPVSACAAISGFSTLKTTLRSITCACVNRRLGPMLPLPFPQLKIKIKS